MRAITVRQPWGTAIIRAGKDIENRSRNIAGSYRGPVAIHAGLRDLPIDDGARDFIGAMTGRIPLITHPKHLGAVVGVVDLVGVHRCQLGRGVSHVGLPVCFDDETPTGRLCSAWAEYPTRDGRYHLVLANPRSLPKPIPCRGRLGLWTLPDDIAAQVEEALR